MHMTTVFILLTFSLALIDPPKLNFEAPKAVYNRGLLHRVFSFNKFVLKAVTLILR